MSEQTNTQASEALQRAARVIYSAQWKDETVAVIDRELHYSELVAERDELVAALGEALPYLMCSHSDMGPCDTCDLYDRVKKLIRGQG